MALNFSQSRAWFYKRLKYYHSGLFCLPYAKFCGDFKLGGCPVKFFRCTLNKKHSSKDKSDLRIFAAIS